MLYDADTKGIPMNYSDPQACWDSESRKSPYSTVADPDEEFCDHVDPFGETGEICDECRAYMRRSA